MIEIDALPQLRDPVLVVALVGLGRRRARGRRQRRAAAGAARVGPHVRAHRPRRPDGPPADRARPCTSSTACRGEIAWPRDHDERGPARVATSCCAPGPNRRCGGGRCSASIVDLARRLGTTAAFTVGGIPSMASHRRPVSVLATGTDEELVARAGAWRQDYTGPTGAQSVLQVMLGDAGIPTLALWAQVPHYLAGGASPPAIRAVLETAARPRRPRGRPRRSRRAGRRPTCSAWRRASPTVPTSSR